jgi:hypothetical protein
MELLQFKLFILSLLLTLIVVLEYSAIPETNVLFVEVKLISSFFEQLINVALVTAKGKIIQRQLTFLCQQCQGIFINAIKLS